MPDMMPYAWVLLAAALAAVLIYWVKKTPRQMDVSEQQQRAAQREARLMHLYQNLEDLMDSFEQYVQQQQKALDQRQKAVEEAAQQAVQAAAQARRTAEQAGQAALQADALAAAAQQRGLQPQPPQAQLPLTLLHGQSQPNTRAALAGQLYRQGLDEAQIARRMGIARTGVRMLLSMQEQGEHPHSGSR